MLSAILLVLLLQSIPSLRELDPIRLDAEDKRHSIGLSVAENAHTQQMFVAVSVPGKSGKSVQIFDSHRKKIFEAAVPEIVHLPRTFQFENKFFYFSRKLYWVDLNNWRLDSLALRREDYQKVQFNIIGKRRVIVASYLSGVDLYDLNTLDLVHEVKRQSEVRVDHPRIKDGVLIFEDKENELQAYDLSKKKILWKFSAGKQAGYYLGIKLGTFDDFITDYAITQEGEECFIVASTLFGCIFKLRLRDGQVVLKKERFKGTGNNAGLITCFELADMNGDGIQDLIGPSVDHNIYCISGKDFSVIWEYDTGFENQMPCSLADINGDGIPDVFAVNDEMKLSILDGKRGRLLHEVALQKGITNGHNQSEVLLGDYTGNGRLDIIVIGGWNMVKVYELESVVTPKNEIVWVPEW
ncbi:MAG: FG-GAP repeat domain-containing protein [Bacteroidota bacterium]